MHNQLHIIIIMILNLWACTAAGSSKCLVQAEEKEKVYDRDKLRWVNYGPFNVSRPYSFEKWTFYFKIIVDLYFLRAVCLNLLNPPGYRPVAPQYND